MKYKELCEGWENNWINKVEKERTDGVPYELSDFAPGGFGAGSQNKILKWTRVRGDLTGAPVGELDRDFRCEHMQISSLKGAPERIDGDFQMGNNVVTSLEFSPRYVTGDFQIYNNEITSLIGVDDYINYIGHFMYLSKNPIVEGGLGLLLIDGLKYVDYSYGLQDIEKAIKIINKYLPGDRNHKMLFECQKELIDAGLERFAQL